MKGFPLDLNTIPVREITCILYFSRWMEMNKPVGFIATFSLQKGGGGCQWFFLPIYARLTLRSQHVEHLKPKMCD